MIPCKEFKCITYPACRNKLYFNCIYLSDYIIDMMSQYGGDEVKVFKKVTEHLPKMNSSYKGWWVLRYGAHIR